MGNKYGQTISYIALMVSILALLYDKQINTPDFQVKIINLGPQHGNGLEVYAYGDKTNVADILVSSLLCVIVEDELLNDDARCDTLCVPIDFYGTMSPLQGSRDRICYTDGNALNLSFEDEFKEMIDSFNMGYFNRNCHRRISMEGINTVVRIKYVKKFLCFERDKVCYIVNSKDSNEAEFIHYQMLEESFFGKGFGSLFANVASGLYKLSEITPDCIIADRDVNLFLETL